MKQKPSIASTVVLIAMLPSVFAGSLLVKPVGTWRLEFSIRLDPSVHSITRARTRITQPMGYVQSIESSVAVKDGLATWAVDYPLVDEGRFDPIDGPNSWEMGKYAFKV